jgi:hypothetical protein
LHVEVSWLHRWQRGRLSFPIRVEILLFFVAMGCSAPPPARNAAAQRLAEAAPATRAEQAPAAGEAPPSAAPAACGQDASAELPVATGALGEGGRVVRLINNSGGDVQARLLDAKLRPVLDGTLLIPEGAHGEFRVTAGSYYVRYRHQKSCQVRRGAPLELTGPRAGVEIAIHLHFSKGSSSKMRVVKESL